MWLCPRWFMKTCVCIRQFDQWSREGLCHFSLVVVIRRWSSAQELSIDLFQGVQGIQRIEKKRGNPGHEREWKKGMEEQHVACRRRWTHVWLSCLSLSVCLLLLVPCFLSNYLSLWSFTPLCFFVFNDVWPLQCSECQSGEKLKTSADKRQE